MPRQARLLELCLTLTLSPLCSFAQGPMTVPPPPTDTPRTYANSAEGLRWELQDLWSAARDGNPGRLESLIKLTEIQDPNWFVRAFGQQRGKEWSEAYTDNLDENEKNLEDLMRGLADEDGEFWVRNIKYEPAPAREIETTLLDSLRLPVNIFFASWKLQDPQQVSTSAPIGYFVFIDGRFRWDSAIVPLDIHFASGADHDATQQKDAPEKPPDFAVPEDSSKSPYKPGLKGVGYPQCIYCPDPHYSKQARRKRLEGTVLMQIIVQPDGSVTDVKVIKSPDAELSSMAVEGVSQWRFKPARLPDGEAVRVPVVVDVNFRLLQ